MSFKSRSAHLSIWMFTIGCAATGGGSPNDGEGGGQPVMASDAGGGAGSGGAGSSGLGGTGGTGGAGGANDHDAAAGDPDGAVPDLCRESIWCVGDVAMTRSCEVDGAVDSERDCANDDSVCAANLGCVVCVPDIGTCEDDVPLRCADDGSGYTAGESCEAASGDFCWKGECVNPCAEAETSSSYIGCEYWPTPVVNNLLVGPFAFAAVVANPQPVPAQITVTLGDEEIAAVEVAPGVVQAIPLPWIDALTGMRGLEASALVELGAYRLRSNLPVTVYQFNPLEFEIDNCNGPGSVCNSYTNDASLLLPTHVLTNDYLVIARPTMLQQYVVPEPEPPPVLSAYGGFFAVIGVEPDPIDVTIEVTAYTRASLDGTVIALAPGEAATFMLEQSQVLQVVSDAPDTCTGGTVVNNLRFCEVGAAFDLTGSEVHATGRVSVVSGHNCSNVPFDRFACDHLEEVMLPLETWGRDYIVSITEPVLDEPNVIRVLSGADDNTISFQPDIHAEVTLDRGEYIELESRQDVRITGSERLLVGQFTVGQDYAGPDTAGPMPLGDPSFSLAIPTEQFRRQYSLLVPASFTANYVNVTAPEGAEVLLDGEPIAGFRSVDGTDMTTARVPVDPGVRELTSDQPFGVVSYGYGMYSSYMLPGGLDLQRISEAD